jgi:hypothetical protein
MADVADLVARGGSGPEMIRGDQNPSQVFGVDESEHWESALRCAAAHGFDSRFPELCTQRFGLSEDLHRIQKPQNQAI